jgi:hypothetical protein
MSTLRSATATEGVVAGAAHPAFIPAELTKYVFLTSTCRADPSKIGESTVELRMCRVIG